jgi:diguanylate cyclase (GGDEF) domain
MKQSLIVIFRVAGRAFAYFIEVISYMYTAEQLIRHPFFEELLKSKDLPNILDSLTGVLLRPYIIKFIHSLISCHIPFSVALIDLDNFKSINDNYGHKIGDSVLAGVSNDMINYLGDYGFVGRIGGDEFLLVNLKDIEYYDKKVFFQNMYANYNVLRKNIKLESCDPFITATIGCATYPYDADNYDDLFSLIDKTLYRGKTKGRNCYIIYVKEKHQNIEIKELTKHGIYQTFYNLADAFDEGDDILEQIKNMFDVLKEDLRINNLYYISQDGTVNDAIGNHYDIKVPDIGYLTTEDNSYKDIFMTNKISVIENKCPDFFNFIKSFCFETLIIVKIRIRNNSLGYLMCAEPHSLRIWQDDEAAILFFASRLLAGHISIKQ